MTVFSRSGLMQVLAPIPRLPLWVLACAVPVLAVAGITELALRKPVVLAPLVKTVERHPEPVPESMLTFEERWAPVQNQWGESRKLFMATPVSAPAPVIREASATPVPTSTPLDTVKDTKDKTTRRQLAQQEVCAAHGLRKVWTSKWRWRCQR